ncbi:MAG: di-trans,poly-cis-decaprenylcistransferase [Candidatus Staskawiczbacteria bacterium RIFCSPHIGHO2_12_FULL_38_11]|uniref:Isoprenyl transferase n=1 Tax=Candidatus Staskawiczbacteria bacterium RIFCSPHIGHO2_12_FULL_38_11 TaxID=1802209 RepID=A0A1G2I471_9BACT|nr:MAG: di-trans,poly-cis-decaprenylcistransferase [Candidatus Staskawiczbacteria bacterium RIFCSPHIGHO2_12_FULL_38_11]
MNIPQHIVLFPDGNRRWAKEKGIASFEGHQKGYRNIIDFGEWCRKRGVKVLTAFGFSTENWKRSKEEVNYLMQLLESGLLESSDRFAKNGVKVKIIGQKEKLPASLQNAIIKIEKETENNKSLHLNLAVSYGGKWDILQAVKKIVEEKVPVEKIDEVLFENYLSTAGLPNPDLVIRAGGEMRLSNFVLWQAAYSELYFSPKMWPEFSEEDFNLALEEFDKRTRRFGK